MDQIELFTIKTEYNDKISVKLNYLKLNCLII